MNPAENQFDLTRLDMGKSVKPPLKFVFSQMLAGAIVFSGFVTLAFVLTGGWPPQSWLIGSSIGGSLSPAFWRIVARLRVKNADPRN